MPTPRITPDLAAEIARLRQADRPDTPIAVIVTVVPPADTGATDVDGVQTAIRGAQQPVVDRLTSLGVRDVRRHTLASAVEATLTASQIEQVAAEPTVRDIRRSRLDTVTTAEDP